ncbi:hypothetical protein GCM10009745_80770 [Kribbella yunnanensis]|uniref:Stereocilin n=1 Tax=Kribbella yunnanensis TaxID=190194 RepID=A0ABN2J7P4_9ACTN
MSTNPIPVPPVEPLPDLTDPDVEPTPAPEPKPDENPDEQIPHFPED